MSEDLYEELLIVKIGMFYFSSNVLTIGCFCGVAGTSLGFSLLGRLILPDHPLR